MERQHALPARAAVDALHIAVAVVTGMDYVPTWNCPHIANAAIRPRIEEACRKLGYEPPVICTPDELMEPWRETKSLTRHGESATEEDRPRPEAGGSVERVQAGAPPATRVWRAFGEAEDALQVDGSKPAPLTRSQEAQLQSRLEAPEMPELLHPRMSDVYREKVGGLCLALETEESRAGARDAIRALTEAILLEPHGERLKITLKGGLAAMLSAARDTKRSPDTGDLMVQIEMVAGGI